MQKKISTTFWFTVAIAIVALLAYTEVGAEDAPVVLKSGNSEITVEFSEKQTIIGVYDTQTKKPIIEKIKLLICEDLNKNRIKDPEEPCYPATFLNPLGCFIYGNPTYYGHGGDGYRREP